MKKSVLIFVFLLVLLPVLIYMVGQRVRLQPKAGGGIDPRAFNPTTLVFPIYRGGVLVGGNVQDSSRVLIQNISSDRVDVNAKVYDSNGNSVCSKSFAMPPFGQREIDFNNDSCWKTFHAGYSVLVVSGDKGIRGILNVVKIGIDSYMVDSYEGYLSSQKSNKWVFPVFFEVNGKNQRDVLRSNLVIFNPDSQKSVTAKATYYKESGEYAWSSGPIQLGPLSSIYLNQASSGYGAIVVESEGEVFAQAVTSSDKRMYFVKGQNTSKTEWQVPYPFLVRGGCSAVYQDSHPYCGEMRLLIFNPNANYANVEVSREKFYDDGIGLGISGNEIAPYGSLNIGVGLPDKNIKKFLFVKSGQELMVTVVYNNDLYWDTAFSMREPLVDQFLPLWSRSNNFLNSQTQLFVFNPNKMENATGRVVVDYYDQFGQFLLGEERELGSHGYLELDGYSRTGANYGSVRVRGYVSGPKGPARELPFYALAVGSQEVRDSRGALLAGDGAFLYQGIGYGGMSYPFPTTAPVSNYYSLGWNRLGKVVIRDDDGVCSVGSNRVNEQWKVWVRNYQQFDEGINKATVLLRLPDYIKCSKPMPIPIPIPPIPIPPMPTPPPNFYDTPVTPDPYIAPIPGNLDPGESIQPPPAVTY